MMSMYYKSLCSYCISFLILIGCSKNISIEDQISNILHDQDGLGEYSNEQIENIYKLIKENPETFNMVLEDINCFNSVLSDDKKVKAYCIGICDSIHDYNGACRVILQNNVSGKINTVLFHDTITPIENIYYLSNNRYLFIQSCQSVARGIFLGDRETNKYANVYEIENQNFSKLSDAFLLGKERIDEIAVRYERNYSSKDDEIYVLLAYRNQAIIEDIDEIDKLAILYNQFRKDLYVADTGMISEGSQVMIGTFRHYHWNGNIFCDITLISPLEFFNEDYFIRIEQENDGRCTYMCWNGGEKNGNPNLIVKNGIRQLISWDYRFPYNEWISDDESVPDADEFIFCIDGYKYRFVTGMSHGYLLNELRVYNSDGDLLYTGNFEEIH